MWHIVVLPEYQSISLIFGKDWSTTLDSTWLISIGGHVALDKAPVQLLNKVVQLIYKHNLVYNVTKPFTAAVYFYFVGNLALLI